MDLKFNIAEFQKFRWAHANVNGLLYLLTPFSVLIARSSKLLAEFLDHSLWSLEFLIFAILCLVLCFYIPRIGYSLAKYIVGAWYISEFGLNYTEYRQNEKKVAAALLLDNED